MRPSRASTFLALTAATSLLGGCVAALVPVAAGVMVADRQMGRTEEGGEPAEMAAAQAAQGQVAEQAPAITRAPQDDEFLTLTNLTALPKPGPGNFPMGQELTIQRFADYAIKQAAIEPDKETGQRKSALLKKPASLTTDRSICGNKPPAVIVDLDPRGDTFDPLSHPDAAISLGDQLARIREAGITVFWSTNLAENFVPDLRRVLAASELDPQGADRVLSLASLSERKQTRREEVAATHCPIAIMGDEKADFDELYEYLRNPENPVAPDALIGAGWFLADPFIAERTPSQ